MRSNDGAIPIDFFEAEHGRLEPRVDTLPASCCGHLADEDDDVEGMGGRGSERAVSLISTADSAAFIPTRG